MCGECTGAIVLWQPSHHPSRCSTLVVVKEDPPSPHMIVKRFGCQQYTINAAFIHIKKFIRFGGLVAADIFKYYFLFCLRHNLYTRFSISWTVLQQTLWTQCIFCSNSTVTRLQLLLFFMQVFITALRNNKLWLVSLDINQTVSSWCRGGSGPSCSVDQTSCR